MKNDKNFRFFFYAYYTGDKVSAKTGRKYHVFSDICRGNSKLPSLNGDIWIASNEYTENMLKGLSPDNEPLCKLSVEAVPYNGTAFLGFKLWEVD